jgi:hypothetical protein
MEILNYLSVFPTVIYRVILNYSSGFPTIIYSHNVYFTNNLHVTTGLLLYEGW